MPFIQRNLDKISNQSRDIFDTYIYKTDDTCAEVQTVGYFAEARFARSEPEQWANGLLEIQCSDGFGKGFLDGSGDFSFSIGGDSGGGLCLPVTLNLFSFGNPQTQVITQTYTPGQNLSVETTSLGNSGVFAGVGTTETFTTATEEVKIETTLRNDTTTSLGSNPNFSSVFAQGGLPVAGVQYDPYTSGGVIADAVTGLPLVTGVGVKASGYTLAAYLDANGSARYAAGFSGSIENSGALTLGAGYNNANPVSMASGVVSSSNIGEEWDVSCNYGSSNFLLGEDAERWCNV